MARPRQGSNRQVQERLLNPDEMLSSVLDTYYPGGQTIEEALVVNVPTRYTPRPSPRYTFYSHHHSEPGKHGDYFPLMSESKNAPVPSPRPPSSTTVTVAQNIYHTRGGSLDESTMRDLMMYAYTEGSELGKQLISQVERDRASDEEWEEFEEEAESPEPISDNEWSSAEMSFDERSEDDGNNQAATVILESPPTDDLEPDLADKGEDSSLLPPVKWLINSIRRRFSGGAAVTQ
ncbi:hypothetical protein N7475_000179 [Penicillium sp. IBT 31633x]|nr:hypothetical protein N7475_000179 [Penicillium sp. IBT 31633x]